jgi:hypothetical protein
LYMHSAMADDGVCNDSFGTILLQRSLQLALLSTNNQYSCNPHDGSAVYS